MLSHIILMNIPKYQARIDFLSCRIPKYFAGFREVPYGIHYINVKTLISQFNSLDDSLLSANDPLVNAARRLQQKMLNGEIPVLARDGRKLKNYLEQRYQSTEL
jgi:hypothetical protein